MGFWDRIFSKGGNGAISKSFDELGGWLEGSIGDCETRICQQAERIVGGIPVLTDEIIADVEHLGSSDIPKGVPQKVAKIVPTSKPQFVQAMVDCLKSLEVGDTPSYADLIQLQARLQQSLDSIAKINMSYGRYLFIAYGEQASILQKKYKALSIMSGELGEMISSDRLDQLKDTLNIYQNIVDLRKDIDDFTKQQKKLVSEINSAKKKQKEVSLQHETFMKGKQSGELLQLKAKQEQLLEDKTLIESRIHRCFNPLKRVLRKYQRIVLDNTEKKNLDEYLQDSQKSLLEDDGEKLEIILSNLSVALASGKLKIKDAVKVKQKIELAGDVYDLKEQYLSVLDAEKELELKIRNSLVRDKEKELENKVAEAGVKIEDVSQSLLNLEKNKTQTENQLADTEKELKILLEELGVSLV